MFEQIVSSLVECIGWAIHLATYIFQAIEGSFSFVFGMFVVFLSFRFILAPIVKGDAFRHFGASDRASRSMRSGSIDESN